MYGGGTNRWFGPFSHTGRLSLGLPPVRVRTLLAAVVQLSLEKSDNDAFQLTAEESQHADAGADQSLFQRRRDGPAEDYVHSPG